MSDHCPVTGVHTVGPNLYVLSFHSPRIAAAARPGQFVNILVNGFTMPLLRRPFSVYHIDGQTVQIIFNVVGLGTKILSEKHLHDTIDVLGPLGCPFNIHDEYETAILVAGGLGVAPMPLTTSALKDTSKNIMTFVGARTRAQIVATHLHNVHTSADDGSAEFHGTVVENLRWELSKASIAKPKIFACGPNAMLRALSELAAEAAIPCEVSLESAMACGIGICQGCPVETPQSDKKYALICKEGTVFDSRRIRIAV